MISTGAEVMDNVFKLGYRVASLVRGCDLPARRGPLDPQARIQPSLDVARQGLVGI